VSDVHRDPAQDFDPARAKSKRLVNVAGNQLRLMHEQYLPLILRTCKIVMQKAAVEIGSAATLAKTQRISFARPCLAIEA
jgi:hypothetical protein